MTFDQRSDMAGTEEGGLLLGFDFSTQQIKVLGLSTKFELVYESFVQFDADLPEFKTHGGVHVHDDQLTVTSPPQMWVKGLDVLLGNMKASGFPFHKVVALSGDGQQHGSVFWKKGSQSVLANLQPDKTFYEQLKSCFSVESSPVWMDASTRKQCQQLEDKVGGAQMLAKITGSRGFERFTGSQIMKVSQTMPDAYNNTERISLVSSFAASLFVGDYAAIDCSDGSGMNLLDIWTKEWSKDCLEACGSDLASKLGPAVHSSEKVGNVSEYLVSRYGFSPACVVVAFTGDNPASLGGLAPKQGDIIVSLGTSDTVFLWLTQPTPGLEGHIFVNPIEPNDYMSLTCFKNGSLTRERIRDEKAGGSWEQFSDLLRKTSPGNNGNIGIYFDVMEIQPFAEGCFRFDKEGNKVDSFPPEIEVRAVIEGQFVARRVYAEVLGFQLGPQTRVLATGGASLNKEILQVLSDVFNSPVYTTDVPNSACLGGAYRAKHTWLGKGTPFTDVVKGVDEPVLAATPSSPEVVSIYTNMCVRYKDLETKIVSKSV